MQTPSSVLQGRGGEEAVTEPAVQKSKFADMDYRDQADFRCAFRLFLRFSEERAREVGITPQQHVLLLTVRGHRNHPRVNIGDVADALQIRHHGASLLVDRCVKRGLLSRAEDPEDRRRVHVWLTEEGQTILDGIMDANRRKLGALQEDLFRDSLRQALVTYRELEAQSDASRFQTGSENGAETSAAG
jgi:DNA-binding MarR family transcriptional regulator